MRQPNEGLLVVSQIPNIWSLISYISSVAKSEFVWTIMTLSSQQRQKTHEKYSALKKSRFSLILKDCMMFDSVEKAKIKKLCVVFFAEKSVFTWWKFLIQHRSTFVEQQMSNEVATCWKLIQLLSSNNSLFLKMADHKMLLSLCAARVGVVHKKKTEKFELEMD